MTNDNKDVEKQIKSSIYTAYESEFKVNEQLDKEVVFALIGNVNVGKSSTINKLMNEDVAFVSAKPGATTTIEEYRTENKSKIVFADTPGLNDIVQDNSEETLSFLERADVNLFLLNAAGPVFSDSENKVFNKLKELNDNIILVLNKIDASDDPESQIAYIKEHTGNEYDIVPISSRTGENIEELNSAILSILEKKSKVITFAKNSKRKSSITHKWIESAGNSASAMINIVRKKNIKRKD